MLRWPTVVNDPKVTKPIIREPEPAGTPIERKDPADGDKAPTAPKTSSAAKRAERRPQRADAPQLARRYLKAIHFTTTRVDLSLFRIWTSHRPNPSGRRRA